MTAPRPPRLLRREVYGERSNYFITKVGCELFSPGAGVKNLLLLLPRFPTLPPTPKFSGFLLLKSKQDPKRCDLV